MASLKSNFMVIFFLIAVVSATITTRPPSEKCKSNQDCKHVKCSGAKRLYPVCMANVCTCFESPYGRPCDTTNDCLSTYNISCSVDSTYCSCNEMYHPNNNAKYLASKTMESKGDMPSDRNGECNIKGCEFICFRVTDWDIDYSVTGGCMCKELFV